MTSVFQVIFCAVDVHFFPLSRKSLWSRPSPPRSIRTIAFPSSYRCCLPSFSVLLKSHENDVHHLATCCFCHTKTPFSPWQVATIPLRYALSWIVRFYQIKIRFLLSRAQTYYMARFSHQHEGLQAHHRLAISRYLCGDGGWVHDHWAVMSPMVI